MEENLEGYLRGFSVFAGPRYEGSLILRLRYERKRKISAKGEFRPELVKDRPWRQELTVTGWENGEKVGHMDMELFFPRGKIKEREKKAPARKQGKLPSGAVFWRKFTRQEVRDFIVISGDMNTIHQGAHPVVQGMFLLLALFDRLGEPEKMAVLFESPVPADEDVYLKEEAVDEKNKREFISCWGRGSWIPDEESKGKCRLYGAFSGSGVHFFTAAVCSE